MLFGSLVSRSKNARSKLAGEISADELNKPGPLRRLFGRIFAPLISSGILLDVPFWGYLAVASLVFMSF